MKINADRIKLFAKYYLEGFLEYNKSVRYPNGISVCVSDNRNLQLNRYFRYPVIIVNLNDGYYMSTTNDGLNTYDFWKKNTSMPDSIDEMLIYLNSCYPNDSIRLMERMLLSDEALNKYTGQHEMTFNKYENGIRFEYENYCVQAYFDNKKIGYCGISDTMCGFGNVVVFVEEEFRRKSIASKMLSNLMIMLDLNNIIPVYWVDKENKESVRLAEKCGYVRVLREVVIGGVISRY